MDQIPFAINAHPTNHSVLAVNQNSSGKVVVQTLLVEQQNMCQLIPFKPVIQSAINEVGVQTSSREE